MSLFLIILQQKIVSLSIVYIGKTFMHISRDKEKFTYSVWVSLSFIKRPIIIESLHVWHNLSVEVENNQKTFFQKTIDNEGKT